LSVTTCAFLSPRASECSFQIEFNCININAGKHKGKYSTEVLTNAVAYLLSSADSKYSNLSEDMSNDMASQIGI